MCRCIGVETMEVRRYFCPPAQHAPAPVEGLGIMGIPMGPQQPTVSTRSDQEEATMESCGGSSAQATRSGAGKRKAIGTDKIDRPPTKRTTRRSTRVTRFTTAGRTKTSAEAPLEEQEPVVEDPEQTCLQKAQGTYHFRACGKNLGWLHKQLKVIGNNDGEGYSNDDHQEHGSHLSLLLLDAFDRTLLLRTNEAKSHILPHEIDELLPLCGGEDLPEQYFPFTYSANVVVPFDVLLTLGVNIFREMGFDTWVIQTVLRKLLLNCVPWDDCRRGQTDDVDGREQRYGSFETLYVHTGSAMFNHACNRAANSSWFWDQWTEEQENGQKGTPNRMIIKASRAIAADEEIKLQYFPGTESTLKQQRLFGRNCDCRDCVVSPTPNNRVTEDESKHSCKRNLRN